MRKSAEERRIERQFRKKWRHRRQYEWLVKNKEICVAAITSFLTTVFHYLFCLIVYWICTLILRFDIVLSVFTLGWAMAMIITQFPRKQFIKAKEYLQGKLK